LYKLTPMCTFLTRSQKIRNARWLQWKDVVHCLLQASSICVVMRACHARDKAFSHIWAFYRAIRTLSTGILSTAYTIRREILSRGSHEKTLYMQFVRNPAWIPRLCRDPMRRMVCSEQRETFAKQTRDIRCSAGTSSTRRCALRLTTSFCTSLLLVSPCARPSLRAK
jgi:hypothetical protein